MRNLEQAKKLEFQLVERGIKSGETFRVVKDGTGYLVAIPFGEEVESEEWSYTEDGSDICNIRNFKKRLGFLVEHPVSSEMGNARPFALIPVPRKELNEFIKEAQELIEQDNINLEKKISKILPLELYGVGNAKTFDKLISEIKAGETIINWENNQPVRVIKVARVYINFQNLTLWESNQIFKEDGRSRQRNICGVSEKFFCWEDALEAGKRGVKEELGVDVEPRYRGYVEEEQESGSYPGLKTKYKFYDYTAEMDECQFKQNYVANEINSITYFEWREKA